MNNEPTKNIKCKLCCQEFYDKEMTEEHYSARSIGNEDIVAFDVLDNELSEPLYPDGRT